MCATVTVLVLLVAVSARAQIHFSDGKKITEEQFRNIPDDPYSDPVVDIPQVDPNVFKLQSATPKPSYLAPRDQYLQERQNTGKVLSEQVSEKRAHMWIDFANIHDYLIQEQAKPGATSPRPRLYGQGRITVPPNPKNVTYQPKQQEFEPGTWVLKSEGVFGEQFVHKPIVWTTCDEFKSGSRNYNPMDIINFKWIPFYLWSKEINTEALLHTFAIPTKKQIYEYHTKFSPYMNGSVDWSQPKLYHEVDGGSLKAMLVSADRTGLYYYILDTAIPEFVQRNKIILPLNSVRMKIVGEYLAMMFCEDISATIMSREGHVPPTNKDKREAAKALKFKGKGRPLIEDPVASRKRKELDKQWRREMEILHMPVDISGRPIGGRRSKPKPKNKGRAVVIPDRRPTYI